MTDLPTGGEVLLAAEYACGFRTIVRDAGLFESCMMRPATTVFGTDAYPSVWDKAAARLDIDAAEKFVLAIAANELTWEDIAAQLPDFRDPRAT